ncbi:MAG: hypothetical protein JW937_03125, partial [Candidatus Omnitrophica bacterium]|nr:hypothetical protein [Candidatus Omnitrophota bacterium]
RERNRDRRYRTVAAEGETYQVVPQDRGRFRRPTREVQTERQERSSGLVRWLQATRGAAWLGMTIQVFTNSRIRRSVSEDPTKTDLRENFAESDTQAILPTRELKEDTSPVRVRHLKGAGPFLSRVVEVWHKPLVRIAGVLLGVAIAASLLPMVPVFWAAVIGSAVLFSLPFMLRLASLARGTLWRGLSYNRGGLGTAGLIVFTAIGAGVFLLAAGPFLMTLPVLAPLVGMTAPITLFGGTPLISAMVSASFSPLVPLIGTGIAVVARALLDPERPGIGFLLTRGALAVGAAAVVALVAPVLGLGGAALAAVGLGFLAASAMARVALKKIGHNSGWPRLLLVTIPEMIGAVGLGFGVAAALPILAPMTVSLPAVSTPQMAALGAGAVGLTVVKDTLSFLLGKRSPIPGVGNLSSRFRSTLVGVATTLSLAIAASAFLPIAPLMLAVALWIGASGLDASLLAYLNSRTHTGAIHLGRRQLPNPLTNALHSLDRLLTATLPNLVLRTLPRGVAVGIVVAVLWPVLPVVALMVSVPAAAIVLSFVGVALVFRLLRQFVIHRAASLAGGVTRIAGGAIVGAENQVRAAALQRNPQERQQRELLAGALFPNRDLNVNPLSAGEIVELNNLLQIIAEEYEGKGGVDVALTWLQTAADRRQARFRDRPELLDNYEAYQRAVLFERLGITENDTASYPELRTYIMAHFPHHGRLVFADDEFETELQGLTPDVQAEVRALFMKYRGTDAGEGPSLKEFNIEYEPLRERLFRSLDPGNMAKVQAMVDSYAQSFGNLEDLALNELAGAVEALEQIREEAQNLGLNASEADPLARAQARHAAITAGNAATLVDPLFQRVMGQQIYDQGVRRARAIYALDQGADTPEHSSVNRMFETLLSQPGKVSMAQGIVVYPFDTPPIRRKGKEGLDRYIPEVNWTYFSKRGEWGMFTPLMSLTQELNYLGSTALVRPLNTAIRGPQATVLHPINEGKVMSDPELNIYDWQRVMARWLTGHRDVVQAHMTGAEPNLDVWDDVRQLDPLFSNYNDMILAEQEAGGVVNTVRVPLQTITGMVENTMYPIGPDQPHAQPVRYLGPASDPSNAHRISVFNLDGFKPAYPYWFGGDAMNNEVSEGVIMTYEDKSYAFTTVVIGGHLFEIPGDWADAFAREAKGAKRYVVALVLLGAIGQRPVFSAAPDGTLQLEWEERSLQSDHAPIAQQAWEQVEHDGQEARAEARILADRLDEQTHARIRPEGRVRLIEEGHEGAPAQGVEINMGSVAGYKQNPQSFWERVDRIKAATLGDQPIAYIGGMANIIGMAAIEVDYDPRQIIREVQRDVEREQAFYETRQTQRYLARADAALQDLQVRVGGQMLTLTVNPTAELYQALRQEAEARLSNTPGDLDSLRRREGQILWHIKQGLLELMAQVELQASQPVGVLTDADRARIADQRNTLQALAAQIGADRRGEPGNLGLPVSARSL